MTYATVELTPAMQDSARKVGEAKIAVTNAKGKAKIAALDAFRAACRESRELHGEALHNSVIMAKAIAGATGGRA